jgi:hypothetical protein
VVIFCRKLLLVEHCFIIFLEQMKKLEEAEREKREMEEAVGGVTRIRDSQGTHLHVSHLVMCYRLDPMLSLQLVESNKIVSRNES